MAHHGNDPEQDRKVQEILQRAFKRTYGEFPDGRLNPNDEGSIPVAIGNNNGRVVMQFARNLNWVGFTADQAIDIANSLVEHARACGSKKPLTVKIG